MSIQVLNGSFRYPGREADTLRDVSFSAQPGDVLAILGPNGAGKTTLLRCMMGLLPWSGGETRLNGRPLGEVPHRRRWREISYVPQARQALAAYTVEEMILLGRTAALGRFSQPGREDLEKARAAMERLGLAELRARPCSQLSGGEFQMVLIARALASEPSILVLDEPESNLDFKNQLLVLDNLSRIAAEGITCIFNTHYPAHALRRGTKALMLSRGGQHRFGPVQEVVTEEAIAEFFGVRAAIGLLETPENMYQDVVPISIGGAPSPARDPGRRVIAGITVIMPDGEQAETVNELLHRYNGDLIGRMGLPYRRGGVNIVTLTLDAPWRDVAALTDRLSRLPGVSAKTTFASEVRAHGTQSADRQAE